MSTLLDLIRSSDQRLREQYVAIEQDREAGRLPRVAVRDARHRDAVLRTTRLLAERITGEHQAA